MNFFIKITQSLKLLDTCFFNYLILLDFSFIGLRKRKKKITIKIGRTDVFITSLTLYGSDATI